ncbi:Hypothetical_protein [Hexamita inflata]|uniref:Hypothetical_protein n=1 Tax=Hexamita inflata TaxID=28002 RepID=A0AA86UJA7_9EUKA|nr:Hypothetical protein HINF_LOCUS41386 [Hexamita inflata]
MNGIFQLPIYVHLAIKNLLETLFSCATLANVEIPPEYVIRFDDLFSFMKFFLPSVKRADIVLELNDANVIVNTANTVRAQCLFQVAFSNTAFKDSQWEIVKRVHVYRNRDIAQFTIMKLSYTRNYRQLALLMCQDTEQQQDFINHVLLIQQQVQEQVQNNHQPLVANNIIVDLE